MNFSWVKIRFFATDFTDFTDFHNLISFENMIFTKGKCYLALIGATAVQCGKQENGNQKKPEPFAPNNKKCYTFVFQIF